jgi:hypothetical protein
VCDIQPKKAVEPKVEAKPVEYDGYKGYKMKNNVGALVVWFIVIFVVVTLALYALKPTFILKKDCLEVDNSKALLSAFIISLFFILLVWIIMAIANRGK